MKFVSACLVACLISISSSAAQFTADWESLANYRCPEWFRDAKFGIFLHWGVNTVPELNPWYGHWMYVQQGAPFWGQGIYQWHVSHYGHPSVFGYKDLVPLWDAAAWDPEALSAFFQSIGARYVVPVASHHDNFDNFDSTFQEWNSVRLGPRRDIIGEWRTAILTHGMRFGVSSHNARAWEWFAVAQMSDATGSLAGVAYDGRMTRADGVGKWWEGLDPQDLYAQNHLPDAPPDEPFANRWLLRHLELLDKYEPDFLYVDGPLPLGEAGLEMAAHFYNSSIARHDGKLEAVMTNDSSPEPDAAIFNIEAGGSDRLRADPWQRSTTLNHGWFYTGPFIRLHAPTVIDHLVDTVSKNGNYLLNVGLRADGTLPDEQRVELEKIGRWLDVNGEAIFATRPWETHGEGPTVVLDGHDTEDASQLFTARDVRFTRFNDILYAVVMDWPTNNSVRIRSLSTGPDTPRRQIERIELLGDTHPISWEWDETGLTLHFPEQKSGDYAFVFKITPSPDLIELGGETADLRVTMSAGELVISWAASMEGFRLVRSGAIGFLAVWNTWPMAVQREQGRYVVRVPQPAETTYYRLMK